MRNKPGAMNFLEKQEIVELEPQNWRGNWKRRLKREVLCIEIGAGKGDFWLEMAALNPDFGWLALERDKNVSVTAVRKATARVLENQLWLLADAEQLDDFFAEAEVDRIYLNFSDPWPKKRNHKRRLTHYRFLETYGKILVDSGLIIMKTDNQELFAYSLAQFSNAHWLLQELSLDYCNPEDRIDVYTEYERRFVKAGKRIYRAVWKKGI